MGKPKPVFEKTGYLKKDRQERFKAVRGCWVNAWRIVDENGEDMVQPWFNTKSQARFYAKGQRIELDESRVSP